MKTDQLSAILLAVWYRRYRLSDRLRFKMNTKDINEILLKRIPAFIGAFPCDAQIKDRHQGSTSSCRSFIFNSDPANAPGQHWVALWVDSCGYGEYFDPYGLPPINDCLRLQVNKLCFGGYVHNRCPIQNISVSSRACGQHCIMFILFKHTGLSLGEICSFFNSFGSRKLNDNFSTEFVNILKLFYSTK